MTKDNQPPEEIYMWFADNGNVRKWSFEPFPEAEVKYTRADVVELDVEREGLEARTELTEQAQELGLYDDKRN